MLLANPRWIAALTSAELRVDLASAAASAMSPVPEALVASVWRCWGAASIDSLWAVDAPALPGSFVAALHAAGLLRTAIFVVARRAAAEAASEMPVGSAQRCVLSRLAAGEGLRAATAAWLPFDEREHVAIGWIADREAVEALTCRVRALACGTLPVLVVGETGVGKELVARALHRVGPRAACPWLALNCAALPESLLESELFGHRRGAFTGALHDRAGLLAAAGRGTLFLDEIGELSLPAQAKLLRALDEQRVRPLGHDHARPVECRIVAATHRDLAAEAAAGRFRHDLFYRLRGATIELAPLRLRSTSVIGLAETFALRACLRLGRDPLGWGDGARRCLREHSWPGNVRELRQAVEAAVLLASGPRLEAADFSLEASAAAPPAIPTIRELERRSLLTALAATKGNRVAAARILGVSRQSLARRLHRHGIPTTPRAESVITARRTS